MQLEAGEGIAECTKDFTSVNKQAVGTKAACGQVGNTLARIYQWNRSYRSNTVRWGRDSDGKR